MTGEGQFDIGKSEKALGQLLPILKAANGETIDGYHRQGIRKDWKTVKLGQIKTKQDILAARIAANCVRRDLPEQEVKGWIEELAKELKRNNGIKPGKYAETIADLTGVTLGFAAYYLRGTPFVNEGHRNDIPREGREIRISDIALEAVKRKEKEVKEFEQVAEKVVREKSLDEETKTAILDEAVKYHLSPDDVKVRLNQVVDAVKAQKPIPGTDVKVIIQGEWLVGDIEKASSQFLLLRPQAAKELSKTQLQHCANMIRKVDDHAHAWLKALEKEGS